MIRIAIINLTGGGMSEGYKKYLINLIPRMSEHKGIDAILCASPQNLAVPSWFRMMDNVTFLNCKPYKPFGKRDRDLQRKLDQFQPDVIFVPIERYFKHRQTPIVCMLQNMLPMVEIMHFSMHETLRNKMQKALAHSAMKRAQRVIAISNFVTEFLQSEWKISSEKIDLVYHGVNLPQYENITIPKGVLSDWAGKFLFSAGSIELFRGLEDIIHAVNELKKIGWNEKVIIAGSTRPAMRLYYRNLCTLIEQMGLQKNIYWAGMLNKREMAWCYKNACVYIMSSKVEACPNTALEAMSYGSNIISSTAPPMPEFFGNTAIYYSKGDGKSLCSAIQSVLSWNDEQRKEISERAQMRASQFSWDRCMEKTIESLKNAIKTSSRFNVFNA